ncbi:MAG TPA: hypothetical protein VF988_04330, partial [Verrucomicrobiae bacterium]
PAAMTALLATGCQTYQQQNKVISNWRQGNLPAAMAEAQKAVTDNANNKDTIIWRLEQGAVLRAAGKFDESNEAFDQAQLKIDDYAQKAKVRLGQEAGALLSNQAELDYEGRSYDGIMLNTYRALNYLALGQTEKARPEIIRAYQRQQDAVEANKKRIQSTQDAAEKQKDKEAIKKANNDAKLQGQLAGATANLNTLKVYADYVNPFTVYLDGLYFLVNAADASDLERAHKSLERVRSFAPENQFVQQDLAAADDLVNGKPLQPATYVIFETGCAPERDQIRIDIPIIVSRVSYVGAAFPTLHLQGDYLPSLSVSTSDTNVTTALVASMDSIVALDFKNELPIIITKTIAATVTKAVAAYAVNEAARQGGGDIGGLVAQIGTAVYQAAVNIADERTWTTLPKEFQVARIPTPANHKIQLSAGAQRAEATVEDDAVSLVYVKSISPMTPLMVTTMKLNATPLHAAPHIAAPGNPPVTTAAPATTEAAPAPSAGKPTPVVSAPVAATASTVPTPPAAAPALPPAPQAAPASAATPAPAPVPPAAAPPAPANAPAPASGAAVKPDGTQTFSDPRVRELCESLKSDDLRTVIPALQRLRKMNATEAVPAVLPLLNNRQFLIIREACRTLAVIGNTEVIGSLQPLLMRSDVRGDARESIIKISNRHRISPTFPSPENFVKFNSK